MTSQSTQKKKCEEKKYPQKMAIGKKKGQLRNSEETQEVWKQSEGLRRGRCHSVSTWECNVGNSIELQMWELGMMLQSSLLVTSIVSMVS